MRFTETDTYPVGLFRDWRRRLPLRLSAQYLQRQIKAHRWRAVRNYFNGYLAEHRHPCRHDAGHAWTMRAAERRVEQIHG
ncbi:hypothetical protein NSZ01_20860 [Nocardioides szechwanensis]|uniref:Uncharacterized protein n=1 Tax=Nocardioides szechwanensis TaxID=1005944 RepID=A0A1H0HXH9_9ACTN|nr:hypothetical protein [Nocardioides szechwanensis]GEP34318.1 hypothetical protein NSZ01_20860 [Nocardioides szechwanensis]SDO23864.1 hypothetical protein SAMN05192576_3607 [Nocardioides szechwanensis]